MPELKKSVTRFWSERISLKWFSAVNIPLTHNALGINLGVKKSYFIFQGRNKHIQQRKTAKRNPEAWLFNIKAQWVGITEAKEVNVKRNKMGRAKTLITWTSMDCSQATISHATSNFINAPVELTRGNIPQKVVRRQLRPWWGVGTHFCINKPTKEY